MAHKFKIVQSKEFEKVEQEITLLLNSGWWLHGSPVLSAHGLLVQALIYTDGESDTPL